MFTTSSGVMGNLFAIPRMPSVPNNFFIANFFAHSFSMAFCTNWFSDNPLLIAYATAFLCIAGNIRILKLLLVDFNGSLPVFYKDRFDHLLPHGMPLSGAE